MVTVSWISYNKLRSIPALPRFGLMALRATALLIVLLLFLNPYFFSREAVETKPKILFLLDDSESVTIEKGEYQGAQSYQTVLNSITGSQNSRIDTEYFTIGSESRQINNPDSLRFNQSETNFTNAVSQIRELEDDFDGAVIISDGIITYGRNPIIQAADLSIPLYTIGLGDTTKVRDITINNVISNPTGYTNTRHTVDVEVLQNGFPDGITNVRILDSNGNELEEQRINFTTEEEVNTLQYELDLKEPGLKQFTIEIDALSGEWSQQNNRTNFSVDVSDSKIRMLHVAFEVHPDVKMIRDILQQDQNIELTTLTWLGGSRFVEDINPEITDKDLIIIHGMPLRGFNYSLFNGIEQVPSLYLQLPKTRRVINSPISVTQLISNNGSRVFPVGFIPHSENADHPILELPEVSYQNLPPLFSSLQTSEIDQSSEVLFKSTFQGVESPNILLAVLERGGIRRATVAGWGWYKLYQSSIESEREYVTSLFSNITTWTSNDPDERRLKISPAKPAFNISEDVVINANLNNESGEPESEATIEVTIIDESSDTERSFNMSNSGNGIYNLEVRSLASGLYSYSATARKGDREIDTQTGEFLVENSNSELINTIRNDDLLSSLASETGGKYLTFENASQIWEIMNNDDLLSSREEIVESYSFPVRHLWWFVVVILLLTSEWMLRKFYSLP
jgi:hypothetical protein